MDLGLSRQKPPESHKSSPPQVPTSFLSSLRTRTAQKHQNSHYRPKHTRK